MADASEQNPGDLRLAQKDRKFSVSNVEKKEETLVNRKVCYIYDYLP